MIKYAPKEIKPKICDCFDSIPKQLAKEYKKFQHLVVRKGGTAGKYEGSLRWIEEEFKVYCCLYF